MEAKDTVIRSCYNRLKIKPPDWIPEIDREVFKAGQLDQAAIDQINFDKEFDKERVKFWSEIVESYKDGEKNVVKTYQRENPNSYKEYEAWWRIFLKLEGII